MLERIIGSLPVKNSLLFAFSGDGNVDSHLDEMWNYIGSYWAYQNESMPEGHRLTIDVNEGRAIRNPKEVANYVLHISRANYKKLIFGFIEIHIANNPKDYFISFHLNTMDNAEYRFVKNQQESERHIREFEAYSRWLMGTGVETTSPNQA